MGTLISVLVPVLNGLKVAIGLGFVIFIHELGHFLLAKWNGVKVEKFSIGFGPTLFGFRRAETEYVLAAVPLGGFVKMLGENADDEENKSTDPRAFHNKTVGARMAIISAGVIMNIMFGVLCNTFLFRQTREEVAAAVGIVNPGSPAYEAGLRAGDQIESIDGLSGIGYNDLTRKVVLSGDGAVLNFVVKRAGEPGPLSLKLKPRRENDFDRPLIGIQSASSLELLDFSPPAGMDETPKYPWPEDEARKLTADFVTAAGVEGEEQKPMADIGDLQDLMSRRSDKAIILAIERRARGTDSTVEPTKITFRLPPNRFVDFGLHLNISPIISIQKDSPGEKAGFQVGDQIVQFDGQDDFDPMRLPGLWYAKQGKPVSFVVERKGPSNESKKVTLSVTPGAMPPWYEPLAINPALDIPGLGICYQVIARVRSVAPDSPAAKAGIKPGDVINGMSVPLPEPEPKDGKKVEKSFWGWIISRFSPASEPKDGKNLEVPSKEFKFDSSQTWVNAFLNMQALPLRPIKLTVNNAPKAVEIQPVPADGWYDPARGLYFQALMRKLPPKELAAAVRAGFEKTYNDVIDIYTMLRGLFQQRIGPANLGGPITIAQIAYRYAGLGWTELIGFLGAMSINLAVLNFLPIPPLDGGQMTFLLVEKIRGRPLPESVLVGAIYIGLPIVLLVMVFATYQDVFRLVKSFMSP